MEHTNCSLPVENDCTELQPKMDPRAWLLKVAIVRIELQLKVPTFRFRSLPPDHMDFEVWHILRLCFMGRTRSNGDRLGLASEIAALDAIVLYCVMGRVEKNDNLREVFARAARSIREAILHAGNSGGYAEAILISLIKRFLNHMPASRPVSKQEYLDASDMDSELAIAYTFRAFLTSVLHLLTSVFQYLIGYVDRGGSKTYSSGAFDFRASFVSLVLFQAAYVWIKFRQAAQPGCRKRKGVFERPIKDKTSGAITHFKYEPRFTPPKQEVDDGTNRGSKRLPLGEYHTRAEAQIVLQIAQYYYDKDGGCVELEDGRYKFPIPPASEQARGLAGEEKNKWVKRTAKLVGKQMYADFQREKGNHLAMATEAGSHGAEFLDPSSSAQPLSCPSLPVPTAMVDEPATAFAAPSSTSLPLLSLDGPVVGDADDSCQALSGFEDMIDGPGFPNLPEQQLSVVSSQIQYQGFAPLPGDPSLPEVGAVAGGIEHDLGLELNRSPSFQQSGRNLADAGTENIDEMVFLPQNVPDLQQLVFSQNKLLENNARQFVGWDLQLKTHQIQNSRLQREKEQLQQENENLKSRLEQVAKAQVATWTGIVIDIQQRD